MSLLRADFLQQFVNGGVELRVAPRVRQRPGVRLSSGAQLGAQSTRVLSGREAETRGTLAPVSAIGSGVTAVLAGVLDGLGASRDQNAGRHWDTPGIGLMGGPVLDWGWAPGVQIASLVTGIAAQAMDMEWGRGLTAAGMGMAARAAAYKVAQRGATKAQGYVDVDWRRPPAAVPPGTPGRSYVSNNFGYAAPDPRLPQSHYVSNYGEVAAGARVPAFDPPGLDQFGGRISAQRRGAFDTEFAYTAPDPNEPQSHYVSTYGALAPG